MLVTSPPSIRQVVKHNCRTVSGTLRKNRPSYFIRYEYYIILILADNAKDSIAAIDPVAHIVPTLATFIPKVKYGALVNADPKMEIYSKRFGGQ
jgi:hypothetical protein